MVEGDNDEITELVFDLTVGKEPERKEVSSDTGQNISKKLGVELIIRLYVILIIIIRINDLAYQSVSTTSRRGRKQRKKNVGLLSYVSNNILSIFLASVCRHCSPTFSL